MAKKIILTAILAVSLLAVNNRVSYASSLLTIDKTGTLNWNVLSESIALDIPNTSYNVEGVAGQAGSNTSVSIAKDGENISLKSGDGKNLDVTNWKENLVELEERGDTQKIEIAVSEGKFFIKQNNLSAVTEFPINIDPKERKLSIVTASGSKFLAILPMEAVQSALRAKAITSASNQFEIVEVEKDLSYKITGEKILNLFNIYQLPVAVSANVSASTGEILSLDQPPWLTLVSYLLS